ncbi:hypothetical protein FG386_002442 [Cryptosporidium ryanae]|uniref:uncharacterized protein n=1 Tax=Cryptosporidium ryanae TaxID=515981 RepID=UPI00351A9842|nr:hypothetical protein FG386_002442 [Cryptosporidium ryanae]
MGLRLIKLILFTALFCISNQLEIGVMREIRGSQNGILSGEGVINSISTFSVAENQLKSFGNLDSDFALKQVTEIGNEISNRLKELMGLNVEAMTTTNNRGAFVMYDTNDYPFACICDSQKYKEWVETGSDPTIKVECTNKINTSIFNGADVDYCDPTNIAASQNKS